MHVIGDMNTKWDKHAKEKKKKINRSMLNARQQPGIVLPN